jgi:hypothetical protein
MTVIGILSMQSLPYRMLKNSDDVVLDFERFNILGKDVFLPTTSPPSGETREREQALKITFSTPCLANNKFWIIYSLLSHLS